MRGLLVILFLLAGPLKAEEAKSCLQEVTIATCHTDKDEVRRCFRADDFWREMVREAFDAYPPVGQRLLCNVDAIVFDTDMQTSAETFLGREIRINASMVLMGLTISEWATWKEQLPFTQDRDFWLPEDTGLEVVAQLNNKDAPALIYILAHELGHVADAWLKATRTENPEGKIWQLSSMPDIPPLCFYHCGDVLAYKKITSLYAAISSSGFLSTYSTMGPDERFAEVFALYLLREQSDLDWSVFWNGQKILDVTQHLDHPDLREELAYMGSLSERLVAEGKRPYDDLMDTLKQNPTP